MRRIIVAVLILALAMLPSAYGQATFKHGTLTLTQGTKQVLLQVEVADTPVSRAQGLMFRKKLPELAGMLFIFEDESRWSFWMKNTLIPLSIGFFDSQWRLVDTKDMKVAADPAKGPYDYYSPALPALYALEVNQCFFKRHGFSPWVWKDGTVTSIGARGEFILTQGSAPPRTTAQTSTTAGAPPTCVGQ